MLVLHGGSVVTGKIAIITDDPGWHGKQLALALQQRGYESLAVSLKDCALHLENGKSVIDVPGFFPELPAGVFMRGVAGGRLEEVVFYLDILHALEAAGIKVYNSGRAIERSVDKSLTSYLLQQAGVDIPDTWIVRDRRRAMALAREQLRLGHALVFKPIFGSQGSGLQLIRELHQLQKVSYNGVYYFQRYIDNGSSQYFDWRVFVIAGHAVAAMRRSGQDWLNNVSLGAHCELVDLEPGLCDLAEQAIQVLGMDYGGVDIISDSKGKKMVLEVNSIPAWKGLQGVCDFSIAELLIDEFLKDLPSPGYGQLAAND